MCYPKTETKVKGMKAVGTKLRSEEKEVGWNCSTLLLGHVRGFFTVRKMAQALDSMAAGRRGLGN